MSVRRFRQIAAVLWVGGIAGMIVSSIRGNNNGWVISCGFLTLIGSTLVLVASAATSRERIDVFEEADAERLEHRVGALVGAGADEAEVRSLVREAMRAGRRPA